MIFSEDKFLVMEVQLVILRVLDTIALFWLGGPKRLDRGNWVTDPIHGPITE